MEHRAPEWTSSQAECCGLPDRRTSLIGVTVAAAAGLCAACSGGPALPTIPSANLSSVATAVSAGSLTHEPSKVQVTSAEVYSRIARGANACWFGPRGRIGKTHILHADAAPSMNGGGVEIVVHERAVDQPKPWGYKAFRVILAESPGMDGTPGGGGTTIDVENTRIPDAEAQRMRAEVFQWATGTEGCKADPALDPKPEPVAETPPAAAPAAKAKATKRAAAVPTTTPKQ